MKAMIFAAGLGTRLKPLTDTLPKALVPIGGKTLLEWQISKLKSTGITDIIVNVHHFPDMIIEYLNKNNNFGCHISVSDERDMLLETGGGLKKAWDGNDAILACNVDILSNIDIRDLILTYKTTGHSILVVSPRETQRYLCFDESLRLCGWTNVSTGEIKGKDGKHYAFSGMQIIHPDMYSQLEETAKLKGEKFSLIDLYLYSCQKTEITAYIPQEYRMMDVGKINQLSEAEAFAQSL